MGSRCKQNISGTSIDNRNIVYCHSFPFLHSGTVAQRSRRRFVVCMLEFNFLVESYQRHLQTVFTTSLLGARRKRGSEEKTPESLFACRLVWQLFRWLHLFEVGRKQGRAVYRKAFISFYLVPPHRSHQHMRFYFLT